MPTAWYSLGSELDAYLQELRDGNRSEVTIRDYRWALKTILLALKDAGLELNPRKMGRPEINYLRNDFLAGRSERYKANMVSMLMGFLKWTGNTEMAKLNAELIKQKSEVDAANDQLRLINKMMRHDFLNNLLIIDGAVDIYLNNNDGSLMPSANRAIKRSIGLIEHIKDLENSAVQHPELRPFDAGKVISEVAASYGIRCKIEGKGSVLADLDFHSVIENLVRNAIVHGGADLISSKISNDGEFIIIKVADNGKGIPDDVKRKLFSEGYSYGETGNSGLGLFIVKSIMKKYGGTVDVADNDPRGSIFTLKPDLDT